MSWAVLRFMAKNSPRNPASASLPDTDANVLFYLNLPPKTVVNHKAKWVITLAYGQKSQQSVQNYSLQKCESFRTNAKAIREDLARSDIYCGKMREISVT
ncbi:hypothetical protein DVA44_04175 [Leclercia sp. W17]|nr:hypothetical protein DVA44_04175 [Leclercia sp. W17]